MRGWISRRPSINTQNIPRSAKAVKKAFIPKHDCFLFFDYKAVEMRLFGYYLAIGLDDYSIINEFAEGLDPHYEAAKTIFSADEPTEDQRDTAKTTGFAILYGAGAGRISQQLGISYPKARALRNAFYRARPGLELLQNKMQGTLERRGYIRTVLGRRLHVQEPHKVLNAAIQGTAADMMRWATVEVHDYLRQTGDAHIVNIVHDEIIIDSPEYLVPTLVDSKSGIPPRMKHPTINSVIPIEVDTEISYTNWANKESYVPKD